MTDATNTPEPQEWNFDLGPIILRAKRWGTPKGLPTIALHGWMDNCASFDFLAPHLTGLDLVALDLAGHGRSDHRQDLCPYNIWQDVTEIIAVSEKLGWKKFALLGHSRGAMISTLLAGAFPDRVTHIGLIESILPQPILAHQAPGQLATAVSAVLKIKNRTRRYYSTYKEAVAARVEGLIKLDYRDAEILAQRGVDEDKKGFYWTNDNKLLAPSEVKFTREQSLAFLERVPISIQLIAAKQGLIEEMGVSFNWLAALHNVNVAHLEGDHHLHMSKQCLAVADILNRYYGETH